MKKILIGIFFFLSFSFPLSVNANDIDNNEDENGYLLKFGNQIVLDNNVSGSSLVFGNSIITNGELNGVSILFGNDININSNVDYALILGNSIKVNSNIINDSLLAGNNVILEKGSNVGRDAIIFGNSVTISGNITRNIHIYASDVIIDGAFIGGNVKIDATKININNESNIEGELSYVEDAFIEISDNSLVNNKTTFINSNKKEVSFLMTFTSKLNNLLSLLVIFTMIFLIIPKVLNKINIIYTKKDNELLKCIGIGLLLLLLIPLLILLLFISSIGTTLAFIILAIYIILITISNIFSGYLIGLLIWKKLIKKKDNIFSIGVIGLVVLFIISFIPVINALSTFISMIIAFGSFYLLIMQSRN